jgi:hypothetical protein
MMTILGYFSLYICPKNMSTARLIYCIAVVLLAATNINIYNSAYPSQATVTRAADVWTGVSMTFIFSFVVHFLVLNWLLGKKAQQKTDVENASTVQPLLSEGKANPESERQEELLKRVQNLKVTPEKMDKMARWVYPLIYVAFNIVYWASYFPWKPSDWDV